MPTTHFVAEDQPEQTADALTAFLDHAAATTNAATDKLKD
jgi:hypothetical protein